jgi:hypothetical protein
MAQDASPKPVFPSYAELEAAGAVIGEVRVITDNIFDPTDPSENKAFTARPTRSTSAPGPP